MRGSVAVEAANGRRRFDIDLSSHNLKLADLGIRAAGRTTAPRPPWLLSDAKVSLNVLRIGDATVKFRADQVEVGRIPLHNVSARASLDDAVLTVAPLTADVLGGRARGHLTLDGNKGVPTATVDLRITDCSWARFHSRMPITPRLKAPCGCASWSKEPDSRCIQVAASANGTVDRTDPRRCDP